ncbi:MAG: integrase catalytic domain-containing protein [Terriglobales bacterium]
MTRRAQDEYAEALHARYRAASKEHKGRILDEYCRTTRCHRKAAIRRLRRAAAGRARRRGRPRTYGPALTPVVERLWEISNRLCGKLLVPLLPVLVPALERHRALALAPSQRRHLLGLSAATLDRLLQPVRRRHGRQPRRDAAPLTALKQQIPIRTWGEWAGVRPGALQGDLVLHCGESTEGFFLTTLVAVDVATGWTELEAIWGLGQRRVGSGVHHLRQRLPFPLREWHSDNGREFINALLVAWCRRERIHFTRGRGYRKNDQAYVEQRNWIAVRRLVGYDRYSSRAAFALLQRLYDVLRLQLNFFRPLRKLLSKRRVGSKVIKRYDAPQTPYQRVLAVGVLSAPQRQALAHQFLAINPATLSQQIARTLEALWKLADSTRPHTQVQLG